jgi:hypothetical protein
LPGSSHMTANASVSDIALGAGTSSGAIMIK